MFGFLMLARGQFRILLRREVWLAAVVLVAPFYLVAASQVGSLHAKQATQSVVQEDAGRTLSEKLWFYPSQVPLQVCSGTAQAVRSDRIFPCKTGRLAPLRYLSLFVSQSLAARHPIIRFSLAPQRSSRESRRIRSCGRP